MAKIPHCLVEGGAVGELMRSINWAASKFGPVETWSQALQVSISLCLNSRFPILLWWGPELLLLYNDSYTVHLQSKHPAALAQPGREVWAEIWPVVGPMLEGVLRTGEPTWSDDLFLLLNRNGFSEETYHTFSYSPIRDPDGVIVGVFTPVAETTERVISARRIDTLKDLSSSSGLQKEQSLYSQVARALNANPCDLPAWGLISVSEEEGRFELLCADEQTVIPLSGDLPSTAFGQMLALSLEKSALQTISPLPEGLLPLPTGLWGETPRMAVVMPLSVHADGESLVFFAAVSPHRPWDENYASFIQAITRDLSTSVTEVRALAFERLRAEKLAELDKAKTLFFSNVSHEFRTPLTLMLGPLQAILDGSLDASKVRDEVGVAYRNGLRLQRLVNSLLDFSRLEAGRMEARLELTDLSALTTDLALSFQSAIEKAGLRLVVDCPKLAELIYVDRDMWENIVLNLISNAFKFTLSGTISVSLVQVGANVQLIVTDTGCGIAAEELGSVFERFYRARSSQGRTHEGTGIGLSLVVELVKLHGGEISVKSEPGQGTTFTVSLPSNQAQLVPPQAEPLRPTVSVGKNAASFVDEASRWEISAAASKPGGEADSTLPAGILEQFAGAIDRVVDIDNASTILIADDNADMRDYIARLLAPQWRVIAVSDGLAAWQAILEKKPSLLITDVMMPNMDGFQLLAKIRSTEETKTLPVIMLSARAGEESHIEGLEAGADSYLSKPFSARELIAHVSANLKLERLRQELLSRQARIVSVLEKSPDFIGIADAATARVSYINPRGMEIVGLSAGVDLGGKVMEDIVTADVAPLLERALNAAISNGYWEGEMSFKNQITGEPIPMYQRLWPIINDKHAIVDFATIATPLSSQNIDAVLGVLGEQKSLNEELQAALAELQNVAYVVSHELQEPVRTIKSYQNLLAVRYRGRLGADADEFIEKCATASSITQRMVDDLWEYASVNQIALQRTDSNIAMGKALEILQAEISQSGAQLECGSLPVIQANEKLLVNLFVRLLDNALKFRAGGRKPIIRVDVERGERAWIFRLHDNGCGIEPMTGSNIFKLFFRGEGRRPGPDGTGMGLPIAKKIVEYFDGAISFESKPGVGSTFSFTMPRIEAFEKLS